MKKTLTIIGIAAASLAGANAAVILAWDNQGSNSPATFAATTVAPSGLLTTGGVNTLSRTTLGQQSGANSFNSNNWNLTNTLIQSANYISFTLQAAASNSLTLTSLDYVVNGSNTGPNTGRWGYRVGGSGSFTLQPSFTLTFATPGSLATWDFDDFTATSSEVVEFRFWANGATSINGSTSTAFGTVRISNISGNDLVLNGSVTAIPEPKAIAIFVISAMGILFFRRRKLNA
jgi:hypothetical protein